MKKPNSAPVLNLVGHLVANAVIELVGTQSSSLTEFDLRCALAALVLRRLGNSGDVGMAAKIFAQSAAQNTHAGAMDDADAREPGEEGTVKKGRHFSLGLVRA